MQHVQKPIPTHGSLSFPYPDLGAGALQAYGAALLIGLALSCYVFPADFLLGFVDLAHPPEGDPSENVIVQRYFFADAWRWPLLNAVNLAGPEGTNLGLLDGIPLLALPVKLLAPLLPPAFHAVNLWYGIAWVLQPLAAVWCLRSAGERRFLPALAVAVVAVSMPAWWNRFGHASLTGHFLILAALGLYLRLVARPRPPLWLAAVLLEIAALLTQPYLALMVLALMGAVPLTLLARGDRRWPGAVAGTVAVAASLLLGLVTLDYLGVTGGWGFGVFRMDALSPLWPQNSALLPWRLPPLVPPVVPGADTEGYNYLGAGLLLGLLAVILLRPAAARAMIVRHAGLAVVLTGLALFSLSHRVSVGGHVVVELGFVPEWLQNLRSTGRFFWPVAYALLIGTALALARLPSYRVGAVLLLAVALLQFADAANWREGVRHRLAQPTGEWLFDPEAMRAALADSRSVTILPSWYCVPSADTEADQALILQLLLLASERAVPASTMDVPRYHGSLSCNDLRLATAPLGRGELRVLTPSARAAYLAQVPQAGERCSPLGPLTLCRDPEATAPPPTEPPEPVALAAGRVSLALGAPAAGMLRKGWFYPEPTGTWSAGEEAELLIERPAELAGPAQLVFDAEGFAPHEGEAQQVEAWLEDRMLARWALPDRRPVRVSALLPPGPAGLLRLELRVAAPTRPMDRGMGADARPLGIQLRALEVVPVPPLPALAEGTVGFAAGEGGTPMLGQGWSSPEPTGAWSDGGWAELLAERPAELAGPLRLKFKVLGFAPGESEPQRVEVRLNGERLDLWELQDRHLKRPEIELPAGPPGLFHLEFRIAAPTRPSDRGQGDDRRALGLQLQALKIESAS